MWVRCGSSDAVDMCEQPKFNAVSNTKFGAVLSTLPGFKCNSISHLLLSLLLRTFACTSVKRRGDSAHRSWRPKADPGFGDKVTSRSCPRGCRCSFSMTWHTWSTEITYLGFLHTNRDEMDYFMSSNLYLHPSLLARSKCQVDETAVRGGSNVSDRCINAIVKGGRHIPIVLFALQCSSGDLLLLFLLLDLYDDTKKSQVLEERRT